MSARRTNRSLTVTAYRNGLGQIIPLDHFENEPGKSPRSKYDPEYTVASLREVAHRKTRTSEAVYRGCPVSQNFAHVISQCRHLPPWPN